MSTPKNMRGQLSNDEIWEARKAQMFAKNGGLVIPPPPDKDPDACGSDCPICKGQGFTIDFTESAVECPNYRKRKNKKAGASD